MSITTISVAELHKLKSEGRDITIIDVRTKGEYNRGHIPGALNLSGLALREHVMALQAKSEVVFVCQSGARSRIACEGIVRDFPAVRNLLGGTADWHRAGYQLEKEVNRMSVTSETKLRRQTHLIAGIMLITALAMGLSGHGAWFYLACLPAFGLMLDALTGICPMTLILKKAPWNSECV